MAWDKNTIQSSTPIREYPTRLTDNFTSIEDGDFALTSPTLEHECVNLLNKTSSTPGTASTGGRIYANQIDSIAELFYLDSGGNKTQITDFSFKTDATKGSTYLPGGFLMQWDTLIGVGNGATPSFAKTFGDIPYSINITRIETPPATGTLPVMFITPFSLSTSGFTLRISTTTGAVQTGTYNFAYIVIGKA